jgi:hypothetical protein
MKPRKSKFSVTPEPLRNRVPAFSIWLTMALSIGGRVEATTILQDTRATLGLHQIQYHHVLGQTFTAEDPLVKAGFFVEDVNAFAAPDDFTVRYALWDGLFTGNSGVLLGTGVFSGLSDGFAGFADVDFEAVTLVPGRTYTLTIENDSVRWGVWTSGDLLAGGVFEVNDVYSGGQAIKQGLIVPEVDWSFRVTPIPDEASTYLLLVVGVTGLVAVRRSRGFGRI